MRPRIGPEEAHDPRPITFGASPQALRTPHNTPDRAAGPEIRPSETQTGPSGALRTLRDRPHHPVNQAPPNGPGTPNSADPRPPHTSGLDSRAKRSNRFHLTPATTAPECGLIQPAICGVKSDTRHLWPAETEPHRTLRQRRPMPIARCSARTSWVKVAVPDDPSPKNTTPARHAISRPDWT